MVQERYDKRSSVDYVSLKMGEYCDYYVEDLKEENKELVAENVRLKAAAAGRGMVSEMADMDEVAVLVCGLYDRIARLNSQIIQLQIERDKAEIENISLKAVLNNTDYIVEI